MRVNNSSSDGPAATIGSTVCPGRRYDRFTESSTVALLEAHRTLDKDSLESYAILTSIEPPTSANYEAMQYGSDECFIGRVLSCTPKRYLVDGTKRGAALVTFDVTERYWGGTDQRMCIIVDHVNIPGYFIHQNCIRPDINDFTVGTEFLLHAFHYAGVMYAQYFGVTRVKDIPSFSRRNGNWDPIAVRQQFMRTHSLNSVFNHADAIVMCEVAEVVGSKSNLGSWGVVVDIIQWIKDSGKARISKNLFDLEDGFDGRTYPRVTAGITYVFCLTNKAGKWYPQQGRWSIHEIREGVYYSDTGAPLPSLNSLLIGASKK